MSDFWFCYHHHMRRYILQKCLSFRCNPYQDGQIYKIEFLFAHQHRRILDIHHIHSIHTTLDSFVCYRLQDFSFVDQNHTSENIFQTGTTYRGMICPYRSIPCMIWYYMFYLFLVVQYNLPQRFRWCIHGYDSAHQRHMKLNMLPILDIRGGYMF